MNLENNTDALLDDIYFKDAFTKTEDKLKLEVNNATIDCLTSKNNKFSLDENGNLIVKTITAEIQTNIVGEVILDNDSPIIKVNNLDALNEGGVYEFIVIGYTNATTTTDIKIQINDQTSGYHHSYINASGSLNESGSLTSRAYYVQSSDDINEFLQTNGLNNSFPVIIEGRMYISENPNGQKKVNYTLRFYQSVSSGQSLLLGGGVFAQNFDNINSITLSIVDNAVKFTKGSRLTVFNPLKGSKGKQGEKGEIGSSNTITIGTVENGNEANATLSGESPNQVLNLVLPKGEKGDKGGTMTLTDVQDLINEKLVTIYPIGSIYMSVIDTNPTTLFGGNWEPLKDKFLLGAGDTYVAGTIGGSSLLQSHTHSIPSLSGIAESNGNHNHNIGADKDVKYVSTGAGSWSMHNNSPSGAGDQFYTGVQGAHTHNVTTNTNVSGSTGNGNAENMPPYITVYMWKRVS